MATDSGQKFIRRNRAPRVHITYEDPYDAERLIELPFVMGVLSDLSGNNSAVEKPKVEERKFLEFDMDNFESRMAAIEPGVTMRVTNKLGDESGEKLSVNLKFEKNGRLHACRSRAPGAGDRETAGSTRATRQSAALSGRQGSRRRPAQETSERSPVDDRASRTVGNARYRQRLRAVRQDPNHG